MKKAYITIVTVITISAVSIAVVISLIFSSVGAAKIGLSLNNLSQSEVAAEACAEEALERIRNDKNYNSSFNLSLSNANCSASVLKNSDSHFIIRSTGLSGESLSRLLVETSQTEPKIILNKWQKVANF